MMASSGSKADMNLSKNSQYWLERLRAEAAKIPAPDADLFVANTEFAFGLKDAGRTTLVRCIQGLQFLHPGAWTSSAARVAALCDDGETRRLLEPEMNRGLNWLDNPDIAKYQGNLRTCVYHLAIHAGRADVAFSLLTDEWPGKPANRLLDECRIAGLFGKTDELRRLLPLARNAVTHAGDGPQDLWQAIGYRLIPACVRAGLLTDAAELAETFGFQDDATNELVTALWTAGTQTTYARARDSWLTNRIREFCAESNNNHHRSKTVRNCAEIIWRLGDIEGYEKIVHQYDEAVAAWKPRHDWVTCAVYCDLAVLHNRTGDAQISGQYFNTAKDLFDGKNPELPPTRGSCPLIASILSAAHRDVGNTELALRFARRISSVSERQLHFISALIAGERTAEAEAELAKLDSPDKRVMLITHSIPGVRR